MSKNLQDYKLTVVEKKSIRKELDTLKKHINSNKVKGFLMIAFTDESWGLSKMGVFDCSEALKALDILRFEIYLESLVIDNKIKFVDIETTSTEAVKTETVH